MTTHYRSSDGRLTALPDLHDAHLANAIAKLAKNGKDPAMLQALKAEATTRSGRAPVVQGIPAAEAYARVFGGR